MKLLCITCMYGRPEVSDLFLYHMKRHGVDVLAAVSDKSSAKVCENRASSFLFYNSPLGMKWNKVVEIALTYEGWTHLMISGDDDFYSDEYFNRIEEYEDLPYLGLQSTYITEPRTERTLEFRYDKEIAVGSGKVIQRHVVEKCVPLFDSDADKTLDIFVDLKLLQHGYRPFLIDTDKTLMVDVKSGRNMWDYNNFLNKRQSREVKYSAWMPMLKTFEVQSIMNLR